MPKGLTKKVPLEPARNLQEVQSYMVARAIIAKRSVSEANARNQSMSLMAISSQPILSTSAREAVSIQKQLHRHHKQGDQQHTPNKRLSFPHRQM